MTLIFERPEENAPAAHAFVVGVGSYRYKDGGLNLDDLVAPVPSAVKVARWFERDFNHPGIRLASLELLLSGASRATYTAHSGSRRAVARATKANFDRALLDWGERCNRAGNVAIFYFCGHGCDVATDLRLLLEDFNEHPIARFQNSANIDAEARGMRSGCAATEQYFFLDACQTVSLSNEQLTGTEGGALLKGNRFGVSAEEAPIYYAAVPTESAYGDGRLSYFGEALLCALSGAGAHRQNHEWVVTSTTLQDGITRAMKHVLTRKGLAESLQRPEVGGKSHGDRPFHLLRDLPRSKQCCPEQLAFASRGESGATPPGDWEPSRTITLNLTAANEAGFLAVEVYDQATGSVVAETTVAARINGDTFEPITVRVPDGDFIFRVILPGGQSIDWSTLEVARGAPPATSPPLMPYSPHEWAAGIAWAGDVGAFEWQATPELPPDLALHVGRWRRSGTSWEEADSETPSVWGQLFSRFHFSSRRQAELIGFWIPGHMLEVRSLPPVDTYALVQPRAGGRVGLTTFLGRAESRDGESLLRYMSKGPATAAGLIGRDHAGELSRRVDELDAVAGAYFLLSHDDTTSDARMSDRDWASNYPESPDAAVIAAWLQLTSPSAEATTVQQSLLDALDRGLPSCTVGLRLLIDAFKLLADEMEETSSRFNDAFARVRQCAAVADWHEPFTTLRFPADEPPDAFAALGLPFDLLEAPALVTW